MSSRCHCLLVQIIRLSPPASPDNVSYRVISTFAHLTLDSLCQRIQESGVIPLLFRGDQAHESLMLRAGELLRALALSHRLDMTVLDALWDAGFHQREAAALACMVDVIHIMEVNESTQPTPPHTHTPHHPHTPQSTSNTLPPIPSYYRYAN